MFQDFLLKLKWLFLKRFELLNYRRGENVRIYSRFYSRDFECKCSFSDCIKTLIDEQLIFSLSKLDKSTKFKFYLTSGYRCSKYNRQLGGAPKSKHTTGQAVDFVVDDNNYMALIDRAYEADFNGLGIYKDHMHVDIRDRKTKWVL